MKTLTVKDILEMRPCDGYGKDRVKELWAGRESLTLLEILDLDIPAEDRLRVVLRDDLIGEKTCRLLACDFAEEVLPIFEKHYPEDKRPREAIRIARLFAVGEATEEERDAARDAPRDASRDADAVRTVVRAVSAVMKASGTESGTWAWTTAMEAAWAAIADANRAWAADAVLAAQLEMARKAIK